MFEFRLSKELRGRRIFSPGGDIEPSEVLLDNMAKRSEEDLGTPERRFEVPISRRGAYAFILLAFVLFSVFLGKTFQFQIFDYKIYSVLAQKNKFVVDSLQSERGVIYDSKGVQLVFNKPSFDLFANKKYLPDDEAEKSRIISQVSAIIGVSTDDINKKISKEKSNLALVSEIVDQQKLVLLETKAQDFPGFEIQKNAVRQYQDAGVFSHVIGYTGKVSPDDLEGDSTYSAFYYIGKSGLEKSYEEYLRKKEGKIRIQRDAQGNEIAKETVEPSKSGDSLALYLDAGLQKKIEEEVKKTLEQVGAKKAAAVAIDPKTGGVLAMLSIPEFDNNLFITGADPAKLTEVLNDPDHPLFNRVLQATYPTGSAIKPFEATAALSEKTISAAKKIYDPGYIIIKSQYDPNTTYRYGGITPHGWVDMRQAIAVSSNIYFYTIGGGYEGQKGLGPTKIKEYLERYGWGRLTGIDLPNEDPGFIPSKEWKKQTKGAAWVDGDTYNMAIGQGDLRITPLQVAMAYSAIANNGTLYKPRMVKAITDSEKNIIKEFQPEITSRDFINPDYLQVVREGMRMAVSGEGTDQASALLLNTVPVACAAKTGTAQTSYEDTYLNWVNVFAPYDNPQIELTIMIENVKGVRSAAVPAATEVLKWYFSDHN